jgi:hypothetical protein
LCECGGNDGSLAMRTYNSRDRTVDLCRIVLKNHNMGKRYYCEE